MRFEWDDPLPPGIAAVLAGERPYALTDRLPHSRAWSEAYRNSSVYLMLVQVATAAPEGFRRAPVLTIVFDWYRVRRRNLNRLVEHIRALGRGAGPELVRARRALCRALRYRAKDVRALQDWLRGDVEASGPWHLPRHEGPGRIVHHDEGEFALMMAGTKPMALMPPVDLCAFVDDIATGRLLAFIGGTSEREEARVILARPEAEDNLGLMLRVLESRSLVQGEDRRAVLGRLLGYSEEDIAFFLARSALVQSYYQSLQA